MTGHDQETEIIAIKNNQIADLRAQLEKTETHPPLANTEKAKLLDLLSTEFVGIEQKNTKSTCVPLTVRC